MTISEAALRTGEDESVVRWHYGVAQTGQINWRTLRGCPVSRAQLAYLEACDALQVWRDARGTASRRSRVDRNGDT
ncbi:hypothetical protein [Stieleria neptunia]|nr:hypothetical protein [Stieleria neptunia]